MITLTNISKTFTVQKREGGFLNAAKALFKKETQTIEALKNVSFHIPKGQMVGYIGPNGAGKSTTIKILCGILTPDEGQCLVNGLTPWKERIKHTARIGVVFGQRSQLWWDVPVIDSFELIRDIYAVKEKKYQQNLKELTDLLSLGEILKTPTRNLSLGQRMRCELAASLLHSPDILFLDEPTIGLDAVSKIAVREFIQQLNRRQGTTVILTTHDMQDIEALTQRILLIGKGQILLDGSLEELKNRSSQGKTLHFSYQGPPPTLPQGITPIQNTLGELVFKLSPQQQSLSTVISHISSQVEVKDLTIKDITAEELVFDLYKEYDI